MRSKTSYASLIGAEFNSFSCAAREQLESEIGRARRVLIIEQAVELRHAIPPAGHHGDAVLRHEFREGVVVHVPVADVVIARVIEAGVEHLPDGFSHVAWLKAGI